LAHFYAQHWHAQVRLAFALTSRRDDAEEVVQACYLRVAERWLAIENPQAFMHRAITNASNDVLRRRIREERLSADAPPPQTPRTLVEFYDVLNHLSVRQRTVVVLRYVAQLDDDEIARILQCRRTTVRSLARRALQELRGVLS
jgi:RNA polymerase sigma factor (sigma-70 family)